MTVGVLHLLGVAVLWYLVIGSALSLVIAIAEALLSWGGADEPCFPISLALAVRMIVQWPRVVVILIVYVTEGLRG